MRPVILGAAVVSLVVGGFAVKPAPPDLGDRWWRVEPFKVRLEVEDGVFTAHLDYEPADGGPRVRVLGEGDDIPWPAALPVPEWILPDGGTTSCGIRSFCGILTEPRPAVLAIANHDEPWWRNRTPGDQLAMWPRLYLCDPVPGRSARVHPSYVMTPVYATLGAALTPADLPHAVDLLIRREGDRVRYRWSDYTSEFRRPEEFAGNLVVEDEQLRRPGADRALVDFARFLEDRRDPRNLPVFLRTGLGVRYVDVLRAVECGRGIPSVAFLPTPWTLPSEPDLTPPSIYDLDLNRALPPLWDGDQRLFGVVLRKDGTLFSRGEPLDHEIMEKHLALGAAVCIDADESAPWSACKPLVRDLHRKGCRVGLGYTFDDPGFRFWCAVLVPPPCEGAARITVDPDATVGGVFREVVRLLSDGAKGIFFD